MGTAIVAKRPVADLVLQALPHSLILSGFALLFFTVLGIALGVVTALNRDSVLDQTIMCGVLLGPTVPIFWLGLLLMLAFSVQVGWFSVSGARGWSSLLLPVLTIGLGGMALVARVTRVAMIEAAQRDFLLLLHARGMHSMRIQLRRLRHALIPMVTILTFRIGWVLGGAVTVEVVFARSGLGTLFIKSLNQYDYPVAQACLLLLAMVVMLGTFLGDILQAAVVPHVPAALH